MRMRTIGMLVVAVLLAGIAAHLVEKRLNKPVHVAVKVAPTHSILVAAANLSPGQFLRADDLRWQAWPRGTVDQNYVVEGHVHRSALAGRVMRVPVAAGEPITDTESVAPGSHGFLAAALKPGMRAVSIGVTATSGLHGMVSPGDRVDLILTEGLPGQHNRIMRHAGLTILRNLRVLAIDQNLNPADWKGAMGAKLLDKANSRHTSGQQTATLEVTPKQVQIVNVAEVMGSLSLSLRSLGRSTASAKVAALDPPPAGRKALVELAAVDPPAGKKDLVKLATVDPPAPPALSARVHPVATKVSYTLDSQVSPLLPPFPSPNARPRTRGRTAPYHAPVVTILRGAAAGAAGHGASR